MNGNAKMQGRGKRIWVGIFILLIALVFLFCPAAEGSPFLFPWAKDDSQAPSYAPGEILLVVRTRGFAASPEWKTRTADPLVDSILDRIGALRVRRLGAEGPGRRSKNRDRSGNDVAIYRVVLPSGTTPAEAIARIPPHEDIISVEPNLIYRCYDIPDDSLFTGQWALPRIEAPAAWTVEKGDTNVVIGIVDTGVDYDHPDLASNIWINRPEYEGIPGTDDDGNGFVDDYYGYDFVTATNVAPGEDPGPPDNEPMDFHGHGTHVSGIAAAVTNNGRGIAGVSWYSRLMALRAGYADPSGYGVLLNSDIIDALYYAIDNGADVINMSFGGLESAAMEVALEDAYAAGVVLVAAAGNAGIEGKMYPAALPYVIAVAATDSLDQRPQWSNYGAWVDVAAPGVDILSTMVSDTFATWSGTSMATPHVTGALALLLARHPEFTVDQAATAIRSSYTPIATDEYVGVGLLNVDYLVSLNSIAVARIDQRYDTNILGPGEVTITGTAGGTQYSLLWGEGVYPSAWNPITSGATVIQGVLGTFDTSILPQDGHHTIRLLVADALGEVSEDRWVFYYDGKLAAGWPKLIGSDWGISVVVADLDSDGSQEIIACTADGWVQVWDHSGAAKPGWPIKVGGSGVIFSTPACADLDLDGDLEIVLATTTQGIRAWHHDGTTVAGWPKTFPWPQRPWASVSIGNLDQDPEPEIVGSVMDPPALYVWNADGSVASGWPVTFADGWYTNSTTALVDIDGDGTDEIVFQMWWGEGVEETELHLMAADGTDLPGWPVVLPDAAFSSPAVSDLDGDGDREIVACAGTQMHVFDTSGQSVAGWPVSFASSAMMASPSVGEAAGDSLFEIAMATICNDWFLFAEDGSILPGWPIDGFPVCVITNVLLPTPIMADIDGDGGNDILIASIAGEEIWAYDSSGVPLPEWPRRIGGQGMYGVLFATPTVADTDGDGDLEVLCPGADGRLYVWDFDVPFVQTEDGWHSIHHDPANTRYLARKQVEVIEPNGSEVLEAGTEFTIRWKMLASHAVLNWDLWYSLSGPDGPWMEIAMDLPAGADTTGSVHTYAWTVPDTVSSQVRVKVRMDNAGADYYDTSDADFSIRVKTAVSLAYFRGERVGDKAVISWEVASAANHEGFHVYRQERDRPLERMTSGLLTGSVRYHFEDDSPPPGETQYWLQEIQSEGPTRWYGPAAIPAAGQAAGSFAIESIHPNPFNPSVRIDFAIAEGGAVRLAIYDVQGRPVRVLIDGNRPAGSYSVYWDGRNEEGGKMASGIYFVRLESAGKTRSAKLLLVR